MTLRDFFRPPPRLDFLFENSLFLIAGAAAGLVWANLSESTYHYVTEPLHFFVNDVAMAFFFALAAAEVWEAMLPGGSLSSLRKAAMPLAATAGGMLGPGALFAAGAFLAGQSDLYAGVAIPMATDIAFSYLVARFIFGSGHPAIPFLLLLAIADDAGGLMILTVFYPQGDLNLLVLAVLVAAGLALAWGMHYWLRLKSFWWYLIPGAFTWFGFYLGGLHPALGLVPVIPLMPHAHSDLGMFTRREFGLPDTLNSFESWFANPVEIVLGAFGLVNAGVALANVGTATALVLGGLVVGKPVGILLCVLLGRRLFGLTLPEGMDMRDVLVVGLVAGIGFTVSLFVSTAAFEPGPVLDAAKMGAVASFAAAPLAILVARAFRIQRIPGTAPEPPHG